jgi:hypothetical protein
MSNDWFYGRTEPKAGLTSAKSSQHCSFSVFAPGIRQALSPNFSTMKMTTIDSALKAIADTACCSSDLSIESITVARRPTSWVEPNASPTTRAANYRSQAELLRLQQELQVYAAQFTANCLGAVARYQQQESTKITS